MTKKIRLIGVNEAPPEPRVDWATTVGKLKRGMVYLIESGKFEGFRTYAKSQGFKTVRKSDGNGSFKVWIV
jgi:hypothetical protein